MKRLTSRAGETLPEVLVALLIVTLTFLFLSGAVMSAARINSRLENEKVSFQAAQGTPESVTVTIDGVPVGRDGEPENAGNKVQKYGADGFYYYQ